MDADVYSLKSEVKRLEYQVESLTKFRDDLQKEKLENLEKNWHRQDVIQAAVMGLVWGAAIVMMVVSFARG